MRWTLWTYLVVVAACSPSKKESETPEAVPVTTTAKPVEDVPNEYQDLPPGGVLEEFGDTPGLVRVVVKNGMNFSLVGSYKNKKREGNWVEFHPNGLVKSITPYVDGKKEGLAAEMNTTGVLEKRVMYHNNLRHGEYKEFTYATVKEERFYQFDKLEGTVKIFYPDGKIMEEGAYKNGTRDGLSRWFNQEGKMTIEYEYKNGELVKK